MAVKILDVEKRSPAQRAKILPGETLLAINGNEIRDVLDYRFYMVEKKLRLDLLGTGGEPRQVLVCKGEYDDLGLEFETYLMDQKHRCSNQCVFCFVDQMPPGMRETLYFKDDDTRLSFLFGNYVTLTNLSQREIDRIIAMHISPINISVHTTDPGLRCEMMRNRFAGDKLLYLRQLADAGIRLNTQLVLCPGLNDGAALEKTLCDLRGLLPALESIAVVPVGLTKYRENLYTLKGYTKEQAAGVVRTVEGFAQELLQAEGRRVAYCADEFYIKAGLPLPDYSYYGDFDQLENGVGLLPLFLHDFYQAMEDCDAEPACRRISVATGADASPYLREMAACFTERFPSVEIEVLRIENDFFGHTITVAGLVTGQDIAAQLHGSDLGDVLLIPDVMLRHEKDKFLDDMTLPALEQRLGVKVCPVENDGYAFFDALMGS